MNFDDFLIYFEYGRGGKKKKKAFLDVGLAKISQKAKLV